MNANYDLLKAACAEARKGALQGGVAAGSVLAEGHRIVGRGHDRTVQQHDPIAHATMDCLRCAGRRTDHPALTLYATRTPCIMCIGTLLQFGVGDVVIGDGSKDDALLDLLRDKGVSVAVIADPACLALHEGNARDA